MVRSSSVVASQGEASHIRHLALAVPIAIVVYLLTWTTGHPLLVREGQFAFWPLVGVAFALGGRAPGAHRRRRFGWLFWLALALVIASTPFRAARGEGRVDLTQLSFGLHERETDSGGREFQWTHERAVFHFPADARLFSFELRSIAPFDQTVTVLLDGTEADRLKLVDHAWHPQRYSVPQRHGTRRYHRVELVVSPVMRPPNDPRTLGVQLSGVKWVQ
ncbi:MAG: hypothetical protein HY654_10960, partial [Acidobacteria bacterium]|nr:hypothetical protein [Acidobacteriota bacterium]